VQVDVAPASGEGELLGRGQLLVAEEDDAIIQQGGADLAQYFVTKLLRQVDAFDDRAGRASDAVRLQMAVLGVAWGIHGFLLPVCGASPLVRPVRSASSGNNHGVETPHCKARGKKRPGKAWPDGITLVLGLEGAPR
jgi:hypothetical protein